METICRCNVTEIHNNSLYIISLYAVIKSGDTYKIQSSNTVALLCD